MPETFDTLAAVDLGSNSFHMIIARVVDGELQVIDRLKEMVRLAAGLDARNRLSADSRARALEALERFGERLHPLPRGAVRAVGTNTLRKARNARDFLSRAEQALGHPIEIVSGTEEARLIYLGVAHAVGRRPGRRLVMDIGGGSTEFIVGQDFEPQLRESKYMGCVSFSQAYFPGGKLTKKRFEQAEIAARQELQRSVRRFRDAGWDHAIGASGTIKAAYDMIVENGYEKNAITLRGLEKLRKKMLKAGHVDEVSIKGLSERRRPVFAGGLAILIGAFKSLEIDEMIVSDGAMREGLLYDLLGRIHERDVRNETVRQLAAKYQVDREHAERVEETGLALLDDVAEAWEIWPPFYARMLSWAATIHEIGLTISHSSYHKHGSYLVENSDLPGFSRQDQHCLWALVRSHRRSFKQHRFDQLDDPLPTTAPRLAIVLRLAVLLNRSRTHKDMPSVTAEVQGPRALHLTFEPGALDASPLTRADLEEEAQYLKAAGFKLTFT